VGRIDVRGSLATVEVPVDWLPRLVKALDGADLQERRIRVWSAAASVVTSADEDHFRRLARLLELESEAEAQQNLQRMQQLSPSEAERSGDCLIGLVILDEDSGLGGRCIVTLAKRNRALALPWNRLSTGAPVLLAPEAGAETKGWRGVVCERRDNLLRIALDEPPEAADPKATYRLNLAADEVARKRQLSALERARTAANDRLAHMRGVLLGRTPPAFSLETHFHPLDASLNVSQQAAVRFALTSHDLAILHGPPGTGKTTAVIEFIRQAVQRGNKVLACAPSNLAVDNL